MTVTQKFFELGLRRELFDGSDKEAERFLTAYRKGAQWADEMAAKLKQAGN